MASKNISRLQKAGLSISHQVDLIFFFFFSLVTNKVFSIFKIRDGRFPKNSFGRLVDRLVGLGNAIY